MRLAAIQILDQWRRLEKLIQDDHGQDRSRAQAAGYASREGNDPVHAAQYKPAWLMRLLVVVLCMVTASTLRAQETLTLTTQETQTIANVWQVRQVHVDADAPNIEVTLRSDTGFNFVWRYIVCEGNGIVTCPQGTGTLAQVNGAIQTINRGEFQTKFGMSLNRWILDRMNMLKVKIGTVGGSTP